jgi:hypothetical protein
MLSIMSAVSCSASADAYRQKDEDESINHVKWDAHIQHWQPALAYVLTLKLDYCKSLLHMERRWQRRSLSKRHLTRRDHGGCECMPIGS